MHYDSRGVILRNIHMKNDVLEFQLIDNCFNVHEPKGLPCYTIRLLTPVSIIVFRKRKFFSPIYLRKKKCKNVSSTNSSWFPKEEKEIELFKCLAYDVYHAMTKSQEKW